MKFVQQFEGLLHIFLVFVHEFLKSDYGVLYFGRSCALYFFGIFFGKCNLMKKQ